MFGSFELISSKPMTFSFKKNCIDYTKTGMFIYAQSWIEFEMVKKENANKLQSYFMVYRNVHASHVKQDVKDRTNTQQ